MANFWSYSNLAVARMQKSLFSGMLASYASLPGTVSMDWGSTHGQIAQAYGQLRQQ